jgi:hypothetical protein
MILLNFSHPLTTAHRAEIEDLAGRPIERVVDAPAHFDHAQPFAAQVVDLVDACGLTPAEWQGAPLLVVPPALNFIAAILLAELHGRMGYFPPLVRLRPVEGALPPRYQVAELLDLQAQRDAARARRRSGGAA